MEIGSWRDCWVRAALVSPEQFIPLVTDLGAFGFILYLVHRTQTHTIPRLAKSFEQAVENQRQDFKEMIAAQRGDFKEMIEREQSAHEKQTDRIIQAMRELG